MFICFDLFVACLYALPLDIIKFLITFIETFCFFIETHQSIMQFWFQITRLFLAIQEIICLFSVVTSEAHTTTRILCLLFRLKRWYIFHKLLLINNCIVWHTHPSIQTRSIPVALCKLFLCLHLVHLWLICLLLELIVVGTLCILGRENLRRLHIKGVILT